jgi:hypothetical protein
MFPDDWTSFWRLEIINVYEPSDPDFVKNNKVQAAIPNFSFHHAKGFLMCSESNGVSVFVKTHDYDTHKVRSIFSELFSIRSINDAVEISKESFSHLCDAAREVA